MVVDLSLAAAVKALGKQGGTGMVEACPGAACEGFRLWAGNPCVGRCYPKEGVHQPETLRAHTRMALRAEPHEAGIAQIIEHSARPRVSADRAWSLPETSGTNEKK